MLRTKAMYKQSTYCWSPLVSTLAVVLAVLPLITAASVPQVVAAKTTVTTTSVTDLQKKKEAAEAKAKKAAEEAAKQKALADKAAETVKEVSGQIDQLQNRISDTQSTIVTTNSQVDQQGQQIAGMESDLSHIQDQQDALVRQLYVMSVSMPDDLTILSNRSISERERERAQFIALKKTVSLLYSRTNEAKMQVEEQRAQLTKKSQELELLRTQQTEQKRGLAYYKSAQADLQQNAISASERLNNEAEAQRVEAAKIENQITAQLAALKANSQGYFGTGPGVGTRVKRGDYVGIQGSTGNSTGDHVHFEVDMKGPAQSHVDPRPYVTNGTLSWPLKSFRETQGYGITSFSSHYSSGFHMGIDIAGPSGSPVFAPADGVVVLNSWFGGYGNAWCMRTDSGVYVLLGHLRN